MAATRSTTLFSLATVRAYLGLTPAVALAVTSLTSSGTVATAQCVGHGLTSGQSALIAGATPVAYNGTYVITVLDADHFTYVFGGGTSPATGSPTVAGPDTILDTLAAQIADRVSEQFEKATGRRFVTRAGLTDIWNGDNRTVRFLPYLDVTAVASVAVDGVTVAADDFALDGPDGLLQLKAGYFYAGVQNCGAVFTCGRGAQDGATLPADIVEAALEQVKAIFDEKASGATGATSIALGPVTFVVRPGMSYNVLDVLKLWKDVRG